MQNLSFHTILVFSFFSNSMLLIYLQCTVIGPLPDLRCTLSTSPTMSMRSAAAEGHWCSDHFSIVEMSDSSKFLRLNRNKKNHHHNTQLARDQTVQ